MSKGTLAIVAALLAILIATIWWGAQGWMAHTGVEMTKHGYIAMGLGIFFSLVFGCGLMVLASASMVSFLLAYGVIRHFDPPNAFLMEIGALGGFLLSMLLWLLVAVATPAPLVVKDAALLGARRLHDKLPEEIRQRIPEELRVKISGQ